MEQGFGRREYANEWCALIGERIAAVAAPGGQRSRLLEAREQMLRANGTAASAAIPLARLRQTFALTQTEERALWILLGHELDPSVRARLRDLNTENTSDVSISTLRAIAYDDDADPRAWTELAEDGPLRRLGLIERTDGGGSTAPYRQTVAASSRVVALVYGSLTLDPALDGLVSLPSDRPALDSLIVDAEVAHRVADAVAREDFVIVCGPLGGGRRSLLIAVAAEMSKDVLVVDCDALAADVDVFRRQLRWISREARLLQRVPLLRSFERLLSPDSGARIGILERELSGLVLATTVRSPARKWHRAPAIVDLPELSFVQRSAAWHRSLPEIRAEDADTLATMYPITPSLVMAAGIAARREAGGVQLEAEHVVAGVARVLDDRLVGLATRIRITQSWDDFVLPSDQIGGLQELLARIRQRSKVYEQWGFAAKLGKGLGVSALFSGPPGTGKTMAAGLVARDLRVPLYQIDLSKIVSKWIGETEKHLGAVFDAAEAGHAILLFDEADSLFGKRTEIKTSNDRHANEQTNFLLQRLETFRGICILTTNYETGLDEAFRRRLSVHIRFPVPGVEERRHLWRALLPANAPQAPSISFDKLAERFEMSGGYIRNAVLRAAFLAADRGTPIDGALLLQSATTEYEAMGKVVASSL